MIKLQDYTPEVYYKQSRDFQFIGRLYDLVLNSIKTNADMIYDIPSSDTAGSKMIDLLVLTLGFKPRHAYSVDQLAAICSVLPAIMKNKGTLMAVKMAVQALLTAEGITDEAEITPGWETIKDTSAGNPSMVKNTFKIVIYIPSALSDLSLFLDLLAYILPAGISCEISRAIRVKVPEIKVQAESKDSITYYNEVKEFDPDNYFIGTSMITRGDTDLSGAEFDGETFNSQTSDGVISPDRNFRGPITNSTIIKSDDEQNND